jgi:phosphatidylinositol glycan class K
MYLHRLVIVFVLCWVCASSEEWNNWAVLVSSSRFWFNYRHQANALLLYQTLRKHGFPDDRIVLMLADDIACNPRNCVPGYAFGENLMENLYPDSVRVDYKGEQVSVENFINVLTGRHPYGTPNYKKLKSNRNSKVLVYLNGHGGDGFIKFQDREIISADQIAESFEWMKKQNRFKELLFISDTCQADSMLQKIYTPNVIGISTSKVGQSSYSYNPDPNLGFALLDRFSYHLNDFLKSALKKNVKRRKTLQDMINFLTYDKMRSDMTFNTDHSNRTLDKIYVDEFFTGQPEAESEETPLEFISLDYLLKK